MADQRTATININASDWTQLAENTDTAKLWQAIGYLIQWNMTFPSVTIRRDDTHHDDCDLVAVYRDDSGNIGYVIGAVWHEDHFGFHS